MSKCIIVGAGEFDEKHIEVSLGDVVIAADGGYKHLENIGIIPDVCLGDFDSADRPSYEVEVFKCEKDDTDTLLAVKKGLELGYKEFEIYGGTGGRVDHTFANIQTLGFIAKSGGVGRLIGGGCTYTIITDRISFDESFKGKISVFSFSESSKGVYERGLKYSLTDATIENTFPIGVSNEFTGKPSEIMVKDGMLLIIYSNKES